MTPRRVVPYLLAAVAVLEAAIGFGRGGPIAAATLGFPGAIATFFFLVLARAATLERSAVSRLGGWLLYGGGAVVTVGAMVGAASALARAPAWGALPLALLGAPLAAIASLRLSTATPERLPLYGAAVGLMGLAAAGVVHLVRVWPMMTG